MAESEEEESDSGESIDMGEFMKQGGLENKKPEKKAVVDEEEKEEEEEQEVDMIKV